MEGIEDRLRARLQSMGGVLKKGVYRKGRSRCDISPLLNAVHIVKTSPHFTHLPQALGNSRPLPIARMYVELALSRYRQNVQRGSHPHLIVNDNSPAGRLQTRTEVRTAPRQTVLDVIDDENHNNIVFLGDPGSGKSSLLRFVTQEIVQGKSKRWVLPILVSLREYWYHWKMNPEKIGDLFQFAAVKLWNERILGSTPTNYSFFFGKYFDEASESIDGLKFLIQELAGRDKSGVLFLLDGLDEVAGDRDAVNHITSEINAMASRFSTIVTSRYTGYFGGIIEDERYELIDLHTESIEVLVKNWFDYQQTNRSEKDSLSLLNQISLNPRLRSMAQNPFLLTLLCLLQHNTDQGVPVIRSEVYAELVKLVRNQFNNNRKEGDATFDLVSIEALIDFSYHLYTEVNPKPMQIFPSDVWERFADQTSGPVEHLDKVYSKSRLLTSTGVEKQDYHFTHLTFHEYFVAVALSELDVKRALPYIYQPHWQLIIRFLGGIYISEGKLDDYKYLLYGILNPVDQMGMMYVEAAWLLVEAGIEDSTEILGYDLAVTLWDKVLSGEEYIVEAASEALAMLTPKYAVRQCSHHVETLRQKYQEKGFRKASAKEMEQLRDVIMLVGLVITSEADHLLMRYVIDSEDAIRTYSERAIAERNTPEIRRLLLQLDDSDLTNLTSICHIASETGHLELYRWLIAKLSEYSNCEHDDFFEAICGALEEFDLSNEQELIAELVGSHSVETLPNCLSRVYQVAFDELPKGLLEYAMSSLDAGGGLEHCCDAIELGVMDVEVMIDFFRSCDAEILGDILPALEHRILGGGLFEKPVALFLKEMIETTPELVEISIHLLSQLELMLDMCGEDAALDRHFYREFILEHGGEGCENLMFLLAKSIESDDAQVVLKVASDEGNDPHLRANAINALVRAYEEHTVFTKHEMMKILLELREQMEAGELSCFLREQIYSAISDVDILALREFGQDFAVRNALVGACARRNFLIFDEFYIDQSGQKVVTAFDHPEEREGTNGDLLDEPILPSLLDDVPALDVVLGSDDCEAALHYVVHYLKDKGLAAWRASDQTSQQVLPLFREKAVNDVNSISRNTGKKFKEGGRINARSFRKLAMHVVRNFPVVKAAAQFIYEGSDLIVEKDYMHIIIAAHIKFRRDELLG